MIIGTGVDIIELDRIGRLVEQKPFPEKLFSPEEIEAVRNEELEGQRVVSRLAGLFAAKEAVMKALGTGWAKGVAWVDISITHTEEGQPRATLTGKTAEIAGSMGVKKVHVSISHCKTYAVAHAVLEGSM
jgi:phosphopantetheine--protein transferase-like protein